MVVEDGLLSYYTTNTGGGLKGCLDLGGTEVVSYSEKNDMQHVIHVKSSSGDNERQHRA